MMSEVGQEEILDNNLWGSPVRVWKVELRRTRCPADPRAHRPCVSICMHSALGFVPSQLLNNISWAKQLVS